MPENPMIWVVLLTLCELFESWWQHAPTLGAILEKIRFYYRQNIFLLFLMHPSLWLVLFLFVAHGFRGTVLSLILVMKASDLAFKLWMIQKLEKGEISPDFRAMLSMPLAPWMPWINVAIYPTLLIFALKF